MHVKINPPGPQSKLPGSQLRRFRRDPTTYLSAAARRYGDVVHLDFTYSQVYLLNHPDDIQDVLVTHHRNFIKSLALQRTKRVLGDGLLTSEGDLHLRQRRMIQPVFHRQRIAAYAETMVAYALRAAARWQVGQTVDMADEMRRLTLAIVGKTLFDADVEAEAQQVGQALNAVMEMFDRLNSPLAGLLEQLPLPSNRRFAQAQAQLDGIIQRMIAERRQDGERGDLLSMLLAARDQEGDGLGMSDQLVRDEALTLFLAGHETTANALTWTWYLLSQNQAAAERLHAELEQVLGGHPPSAADVDRLPYTRQVFSEAMRLYPPAWVVGRQALADYPLRDYIIPAGANLLMSQWVVHHDPRFYPEPQRFEPDRWMPAAQAQRPKFAYFPFGGGPRLCIGEPFAWMEGILILATLAQAWRPRLAPDQTIDLLPRITLRPRYGMRMLLEQAVQAGHGIPQAG
jgi:cytochrome P450